MGINLRIGAMFASVPFYQFLPYWYNISFLFCGLYLTAMQKLLLFCFFLAMNLVCLAKKAPGYFISRESQDTVWVDYKRAGTKKSPEFSFNQESIVYYNSSGKKQFLMPGQVLEATLYGEKDTVKLYSLENTIGLKPKSFDDDGYQFFERLEDGLVKLYSYTEYIEQPASIGPNGIPLGVGIKTKRITYALQYADQSLMKVMRRGFSDDMYAYFGDCPELADKIAQGQFSYSNLQLLVQLYNKLCAAATATYLKNKAEPLNGF